MSLKYRNASGVETPVAGLNGTSGELVPSVSLYQSGTVTFEVIGAFENASENVVFPAPMPDADYEVSFSISNSIFVGLSIAKKTVNGFRVYAYRPVDEATPIAPIVKWTAFKLMTDTVHEADSARIAQNTANFAPAFSEVTSYAVGDYVTYNNVLYRCTTAHTAGVWVAGHFTQVTVGGTLNDIVPSDASSINKLVTAANFFVTAAGDNTTAAGPNVASTWRIISNGSLCICHGVNTEAFNTSATSMTSMQLPSGYVFDGIISANVFIDGKVDWVTGASHVSGNGAGTYITGSGLVTAGSFRQIVFAHKS